MSTRASLFLDCPATTTSRIHRLASYWAADGRQLPDELPQDPYEAPEEVRAALIGLQQLLTDEQWSSLREAVAGLIAHPSIEAWHEAVMAEARAEAAARRRLADERLATLLQRLAVRPFSITQATLDAIAPRDEQQPLRHHIRSFAREWFASRAARVEGQLPDDAQLDVITHIDGHLLVSARAGSGKTRALTHRALFLQEELGVGGEEMLLLAFNRKAAEELAARLGRYGCTVPHVMTFHALAVALERPHADIVTDDEDESGTSRLRETLSAIVRELEREPSRATELADLMLALSQPERLDLEYLSRFSWRALDGTWVESISHKLLLDFLIEHGRDPRYREWVGTAERGRHRACVVFEWKQQTIELVLESDRDRFAPPYERRPADIRLIVLPDVTPTTRRQVFATWTQCFDGLGLRLPQLTRDQLWTRIAHVWRAEFVALATTYVLRMRNSGRDVPDRRAWVAAYATDEGLERRFLALAEAVAQRYEDAIGRGEYTDFQEVLLRACRRVESGATTWMRSSGPGDIRRLRHVMVDEFQDVSPLFMRLLLAVRAANPDIQVMGVGDDWQAINGFAGATTHYFHEFAEYFPGATRLSLLTNHRSAAAVVTLGNHIMADRGAAASAKRRDPGRLHLAQRAFLSLLPEERQRPGGAHLAAVRRLVAKEASRGKSIVLLSRVREPFHGLGARWMSEVVKDLALPPGADISGSTIHRFKGKESSVAILLDATTRRFPTISSLWFLLRIFGDTISSLIEDERRLLYVATSRAADTLYVVSDAEGLSSLFGHGARELDVLDWRAYPPPNAESGGFLSLVLTNLDAGYQEHVGTAPIKDQLKAAGFVYAPQPQPHWTKLVPGDRESLPALVEEERASSWSGRASRIVAEFRDARGTAVSSYVVTGRQWTQFGKLDDAVPPETDEVGSRAIAFPLVTRVAGVTFSNRDGSSRQRIIAEFCSPGQTLLLVREPNNSHDRNAIAVYAAQGLRVQQIGFVSADLARDLAQPIDDGLALNARILELTGGGDYAFGVTMEISR